MLKRFFIIFLLLVSTSLFAKSLKEKFLGAKVGDYIVTEQDKTCSLMRIHSREASLLILEEISIPSHLTKKINNWRKWVENEAPGHTSWMMYEIDLNTCQILECFSFTRKSWLVLSENDHLLSTLLKLDLTPVPIKNRKKIGPPPTHATQDWRKIWNPPLFKEGKKIQKTSFDVFSTSWPSDQTELSGKKLCLYFDSTQESFPFPYWIQISDGTLGFRLRALDSGHELLSFMRQIPRRPVQIKTVSSALEFKVESPKYFQDFELIAIDIDSSPRLSIPLSFQIKTREKESLLLQVERNNLLTKNHHYIFILSPKQRPDLYSESEPFFYK